jgi:hypothetical protein
MSRGSKYRLFSCRQLSSWCTILAIVVAGGLAVESSSDYSTIASEIAARWNLTSLDATRLLELQFHRQIDQYNRTGDFLHFHHKFKTGGTTISKLMNRTLGALIEGHRGILPGSHVSGPFVPTAVFDLLSGGGDDASKAEFPYLASYSHNHLRPVHGPHRTDLAIFFEKYFALPNVTPRRLKLLGMLRDPTNLLASTHAMVMCSLNSRVAQYNEQRRKQKLGLVCSPELGLNISALWDNIVDAAMSRCPTGTSLKELQLVSKRHRDSFPTSEKMWTSFLCTHGPSAMDYCRRPTELLSSPQYRMRMRSLLRSLMGRYVASEGMFAQPHGTQSDSGYLLEEVERYTLIDLGGLDHDSITHASDASRFDGLLKTSSNNNEAEPYFLWFGITERMHESVCLFSYTLGVMMPKQIPRERVFTCRPTSWWTEEHRAEVVRNEPYDYALWRVANAILDVRIMKMRSEVRRRIEDKDNVLTKEERERYVSLVEASCLE